MSNGAAEQGKKRLLVTTVGGTPAPIVAGILHVRPARVIFVCSPETKGLVDQGDSRGGEPIVAVLRRHDFPLDEGRYAIVEVEDSQNLETFVSKMRRSVEPKVRNWIRRGEDFEVFVDFTGGTKCMSAGMVLASLDWRCRWQYVGGTERTKDGVGIVVDGKEQAVYPKNPWDTLAWRHVLRAAALFDEGDTGAAVTVLKDALRTSADGEIKKALAALQNFCSIYWHWDAFRHKEALKSEKDFLEGSFSLACILSQEAVEELRRRAGAARPLLEQLAACEGPEPILIADIYRNGERRMREERWDDAAARFYRCTEALAQGALRGHGIESTDKVPVQKIPEQLREKWCLESGAETISLALRRSYELLEALGDPLGRRFLQSRFGDLEKTPLTARNYSILAHGFRPVSKADAEALQKELQKLVEKDPGDPIPAFPKLGDVIELR